MQFYRNYDHQTRLPPSLHFALNKPYFQVNPSKSFLDHSRFRLSQEGLINTQSRNADFGHVDSQSGFTRIFILHENIHAMHVVT